MENGINVASRVEQKRFHELITFKTLITSILGMSNLVVRRPVHIFVDEKSGRRLAKWIENGRIIIQFNTQNVHKYRKIWHPMDLPRPIKI